MYQRAETFAAAAVLTLLVACGPTPQPQERPKNILILCVDALRADHLGTYGYDRELSPEIDRLAASGAVFENAYSQGTWTLPSVSSLFLSQYISTHQIEHPKLKIPDDARTLAEILQGAGFRTSAFVMGGYTTADFGMDQGFEEFQSHSGTVDQKNAKLVEWLKTLDGQPFFTYMHYVDVHHPYTEPNPYGESYGTGYQGFVKGSEKLPQIAPRLGPADLQHLMDLYDDSISFTDQHLGRLLRDLEDLGLRDDTLIVLTADHGEAFGEHRDQLGHRGAPYEELVKVPLIVSGPGVDAGLRLDQPVEAIDLAPTFLALLGIPAGPTMQGVDVSPLWRGVTVQKPYVLTEFLPTSLKAIRRGNWKLLHDFSNDISELYDLEADPGETRNLAPQEPERVEELLRVLNERVRRNHETAPETLPEGTDWEAETRRQLEALGYI